MNGNDLLVGFALGVVGYVVTERALLWIHNRLTQRRDKK